VLKVAEQTLIKIDQKHWFSGFSLNEAFKSEPSFSVTMRAEQQFGHSRAGPTNIWVMSRADQSDLRAGYKIERFPLRSASLRPS
jgi:hypothetical protein